jgi:hypothetical protein
VNAPVATPRRGVIHWLTIAAFAFIGVAAAIGNELPAQNVDPQYARTIIDRVAKYGGTFYQAGIHNKGPLEPAVYAVASWFTTSDGFWYAISLFIALAAIVLAGAAFSTARTRGASRELALAASVVFFFHMTLSDSDYARVLYARNMTVCLLAGAWMLALTDRAWRSERSVLVAAIATGVMLGLAVQTLLTNAFEAAVVLVVFVGFARTRGLPAELGRRIAGWTMTSAALTFLSAPVYYALRGSWSEFWEGWWVQARDMSTGTGRSLGSQLALGFHQFTNYYQDRPVAAFLISAFVIVTVLGWRDGDARFRLVYGGLVAWLAAAWIELVLSQRYSSHYFVVSTVPTALMIAALAGDAYRFMSAHRSRPLPAPRAWPILALVATVFFSGTTSVRDAAAAASSFTSPRATEVDRERNTGGEERTALAVFDLVSRRGDPLLTWSNDAWPYLKFHRVAATRFIWKSFLMGEIYLGRSGPRYVLPHTWTWFARDVAQSQPVVFYETTPRAKGTPFDRLITERFEPVLSSPKDTVYLRRDVADAVLRPRTPTVWTPPRSPSAQWTVDGNHVVAEAGAAGPLTLTTHSCTSLSGTIATGAAPVRFEFTDNSQRTENLHLTVTADQVIAGSDVVDYLRLPSDSSLPTTFSFVVGRRAAALVLGGRVRGALRLPQSVSVSLLGAADHAVDVADLHTGPAFRRAGC